MGVSVAESVVMSENLKPEFSEKSARRRTGYWNYSSSTEGARLCGASEIQSVKRRQMMLYAFCSYNIYCPDKSKEGRETMATNRLCTGNYRRGKSRV